jgi:hypothetical protein
MIPPRDKVMVCMPVKSHFGQCTGNIQGMIQCLDYYSRPLMVVGQSNISLARNELAHTFLEKFPEFEWSMWIDSDIVFTPEDWLTLWEGDEEVVSACYSRKVLGEPATEFGLGFTRVHRSVFEKIKELTTDDGQEHAQRFYHKGAMLVNYFPNGANPAGRWLGEDHGFFMLASLTDCKPRLEKRTKLRHVGEIEFGYPNQIPVEMLLKLLTQAGFTIAETPA